jgi:hypothetical protein
MDPPRTMFREALAEIGCFPKVAQWDSEAIQALPDKSTYRQLQPGWEVQRCRLEGRFALKGLVATVKTRVVWSNVG